MKIVNFLVFGAIFLYSSWPAHTFKLIQWDNRIVGGIEISIKDAPWQISLQSGGRHRCGGSIISKDWILTAGHCSDGYSPQKLTVRIGSQHHTEGGTIEKLKEVHVHEDYNPSTVDFDYSLLKLKTPLNFTDLVQPILLSAIDEAEIPDQTLCTVSGWGNTMNSSESTLKLRAATVPIVNQDICVEKYETKAIVTPRMICAGFDEGGKDSCQGDSGGPLTCIDPTDDKRKIYGIVSWGYGCARKDYPGVYGRVSAARKWIKKMTNI